MAPDIKAELEPHQFKLQRREGSRLVAPSHKQRPGLPRCISADGTSALLCGLGDEPLQNPQ